MVPVYPLGNVHPFYAGYVSKTSVGVVFTYIFKTWLAPVFPKKNPRLQKNFERNALILDLFFFLLSQQRRQTVAHRVKRSMAAGTRSASGSLTTRRNGRSRRPWAEESTSWRRFSSRPTSTATTTTRTSTAGRIVLKLDGLTNSSNKSTCNANTCWE